MAKNVRGGRAPVPQVVQDALAFLEKQVESDADWSALGSFSELGDLVSLLGPTDAGIMIRSSDHGRARSIGTFVGGQSQWTTCRDDRELLAMLQAITTTLTTLAGGMSAGEPSQKAVRARKR